MMDDEHPSSLSAYPNPTWFYDDKGVHTIVLPITCGRMPITDHMPRNLPASSVGGKTSVVRAQSTLAYAS